VNRRLLTFLSALSLLLFVAVILAWVRARSVARSDHVSMPIPGGRVVARFDPGGIALAGPPPAGPAPGEAAVRTLTAVMRNGDLAFACASREDDYYALKEASYAVTIRDERSFAERDFTANTPNATVSLAQLYGEGRPPVMADAYRRPLLEALEDPNRFAAAHHLLYKIGWRFGAPGGTIHMYGALTFEDGVYVLDQDGLRVEFPPPDENTERRPLHGVPGSSWTYYLDKPRLARIDPAQVPSIRNRWYMVLGMPLVTVPYWAVAPATLVLPAIWLGVAVRSAARRRRGRCARCGYDLRASKDRCPECGEAIRKHVRRAMPRPFPILSALSLLLCVAVVVLWVRSYHGNDLVRTDPDAGGWRFFSLKGWVGYDNSPAIAIASARQAEYETAVMFAKVRREADEAVMRERERSGLTKPPPAPPAPPLPPRPPPPPPRRTRSIPYALVAAILIVLPVLWVGRRLAARRRAARGRAWTCPSCAYDLCATSESCPNCGWTPPAPPAPPT
jgi:hypothetical protein